MENWSVRFSPGAWNRSIRENIWRRHQDPSNSVLSGWQSPADCRRRLVHFHDHYTVNEGNFVLKSCYLYLNIKAPAFEIEQYLGKIEHLAAEGGWDYVSGGYELGDLTCRLLVRNHNPQESSATPGYLDLEFTLQSKDFTPSEEIKNRPWDIFRLGIRQKNPRGNPTLLQPTDLRSLVPAQIELGCGPSIEAGIPALNYLHGIYSITRPDGKFVLTAQDDRLLNVLSSPEQWYEQASHIHRACLLASPTAFYLKLKQLHDERKIVGPVIANNFDGLPLSVGLEEMNLRQFDRQGVYPPTDFHPEAKYLWVIGSHADRRENQQHARKAGLKIVFIDPEGYDTGNGFQPYPLEAPQDGDFLVRCSAGEALEAL